MWVRSDRKEKTLNGFFDLFEAQREDHLQFVLQRMWQAVPQRDRQAAEFTLFSSFFF